MGSNLNFFKKKNLCLADSVFCDYKANIWLKNASPILIFINIFFLMSIQILRTRVVKSGYNKIIQTSA